jgi:putative transposase
MGKGRKNGTTRKEAPPEAAEFTSRDRRVQVALDEIAASAREGLVAVAVGAGLQVMQALMEDDVTTVCGPKGRHDPERIAVRHGHEPGSVTLGGRRVPVSRPRMRATNGAGELPVASYEEFTGTEVLGRMALERMLAGLSTRRYPVGLEPVGEQVEASGSSTSKSAVSRTFVRATETALTELLTADLSELDLVAGMVDGVHFAEHCCVVALGIDGAFFGEGPSTRWRWPRGRPRTPPWCAGC